jgi:hypothetical protein
MEPPNDSIFVSLARRSLSDDHFVAVRIPHARDPLAPRLIGWFLKDAHSLLAQALDRRVAVVGVYPTG